VLDAAGKPLRDVSIVQTKVFAGNARSIGDAAFDRIWASDALTWESLDDWSRRAGAPQAMA
jgi:hypothetical protein